MMGGDTYTISEETRNGLAGASGLCHLREIDTMVNINSISSITPEDRVAVTEKTLYDGTVAVLKRGVWVDKYSEVRLDTNYYKQLDYKEKELIKF